MRYRLFVLSLFAACLSFAQTPAPAGGVTVTLNGVRNANGKVVVALYTQGDGFPTKGWVKIVKVPAQKGKTTAHLDIEPGRYAISAYHDENDDGKMNSGLLGPTEGYAFGNDARGTLSAPNFDKCFMNLNSEPVELKVSY